MKKCKLLIVCLYSVVILHAQYNNEWIDYAKPYYKCKVGGTGLCRISSETLAGLGLGAVPAEQFQLWHNGKEVSIYTSATSGILPAGGYLEFWGEMNDGDLDGRLYKNPAQHLNATFSFSTDTSSYFLTVNPGNNLRFAAASNDIQNNTLSPQSYFLYTYKADFKEQINRGKGLYYGETIYSSTYDVGEFWSSGDIADNSSRDVTMNNLNVAANGPAASLTITAAGNSTGGSNRKLRVSVNNVLYINQPLTDYNAGTFSASNIPVSLFSSNAAKINIASQSTDSSASDNLVAGMVHLTYPHTFNFGGAKNFAFSLAASGNGNYLEITNFNGGGTPVLYDLTNHKRYLANTATPNVLKFKIFGSSTDQALSLVLVNEDVSNSTPITSFTKRTFTDYSAAANTGDYLIITNSLLLAGDNSVEQFRQYRASAAGGGFAAKIYDADELIDQFAWGVKKHPLGIKNFLQYARAVFSIKPRFVFIIGKGIAYDSYRYNESSPFADRLNLVPTFGWPASDAILASASFDPVAATPIGRLSVVKGSEVKDYLAKVKEYEQQQSNTTQTIDNKAWMKTVVNVTGANNTFEDAELSGYLNKYGSLLRDTLFGGSVYSFNKTTTGEATPITDAALTQLFNNGISIFNYFGHSSSTTLNYNLNDPQAYSNGGKYPFFIASGCDAADFFGWDTARFNVVSSIAEKYVLAPERGAIAMLGSTNFGVGAYIDYYNTGFYKSFSAPGYNKDVSVNMAAGANYLLSQRTFGDFDSSTKYLHAEQILLHGDPAIKINAFAKPDFAVEEPQIVISPSFVSVANATFTVKAYLYNIGKATGDSLSVLIQRQHPDGTIETVLSGSIRAVRYKDSVSIELPVVASKDKGQNKIIVTIDNTNQYDELSESNNTASKTFLIYEDAITPIYPYNYSIVNKSNIKFAASTADPTLASRQYTMEMDTSALFNSSFKITKTVASLGGLVEWEPSVSFTDSTVYYWRVAPVPPANEVYRWTASSFIYLAKSSFGYNQSHLYQHLASSTSRMYLDSISRVWTYINRQSTIQLTNSVYEVSGTLDGDFEVRVNGNIITQSACLGHSVIYNVFDPVTLKPLFNQATPSTTDAGGKHGGFMGSALSCEDKHQGAQYNFEFSYLDTTGRRKMRDFMDWVKSGYIVTARIIFDKVNDDYNQNPFAPDYKKDQQTYGVGNSWYDRLVSSGFTHIDSFTYPRVWVFLYKKGDASPVTQRFSAGLSDKITVNTDVASPDSLGFITSPVFGPAKAWKSVKWRGKTIDATAGDKATVDVIGVATNGQKQTLYTLSSSQQDFDISNVSASQYPSIQLQMRTADSIHFTPYQLGYWRVLYDPVPEGALSANVAYSYKDSLGVGEVLNGKIGFKNVSDVPFSDSIKVKAVVYNKSNVPTIIPVNPNPLKRLAPGDTAVLNFSIDSKQYSGSNTFYLDVNPDNSQPEQTHENNFLYKALTVSTDVYNPLLDVTFDGVHILNNDIVSAKPYITIKLTDESKYLLLNDTSLVNVQLQYPDGSLRKYNFKSDTLKFTPATDGANNAATVEFLPYLPTDGQYKLLVSGKDRNGNTAGNTQYSVSFQVINKPMISDLFNYPNPFTTSTAFVFTVTGSEVPQNLRIQILTVTGKIVKEILKEELGDVHIGRNITEYKWDGTDQYGQKLANGVYLYRVLTNLNGKSLDHFNIIDADGNTVNTSQYFNKGYGKMYLMR